MRRRKLAQVHLQTSKPGSAGQTEFTLSKVATPVPCNTRPLSTDEIQFWGDHSRETRVLYADSWPGDIDCLIKLDGSDWDQVAAARVYDYGAATQHVEVIIRRRKASA